MNLVLKTQKAGGPPEGSLLEEDNSQPKSAQVEKDIFTSMLKGASSGSGSQGRSSPSVSEGTSVGSQPSSKSSSLSQHADGGAGAVWETAGSTKMASDLLSSLFAKSGSGNGNAVTGTVPHNIESPSDAGPAATTGAPSSLSRSLAEAATPVIGKASNGDGDKAELYKLMADKLTDKKAASSSAQASPPPPPPPPPISSQSGMERRGGPSMSEVGRNSPAALTGSIVGSIPCGNDHADKAQVHSNLPNMGLLEDGASPGASMKSLLGRLPHEAEAEDHTIGGSATAWAMAHHAAYKPPVSAMEEISGSIPAQAPISGSISHALTKPRGLQDGDQVDPEAR
jgi:hypothetical protein